ncbi:methylmalonyl Co-A mutase-associated GTPase MeaB [Alkalihalobacterium bogoriense]|uniref:methylmalonyl Co-A mutase-associated GTPase MeaB n=1 Tax=Alkalihalobacterium bogoriense TaxID=246272 RepID=UPI000554EAEA|nr:methylmalonyl Co-A mutase-associated GTPase MeaB [Alkalihalobacterium bogoriense]
MTRNNKPRRKQLTVDDYVDGVLSQNRAIVAQAITLVESQSQKHTEIAQQVLTKLSPHTGQSIRIGFTGVPGAGKSTLIESFGTMLCERGHRVAVLAVDPSSTLTRGSILGDKTRMDQLSRHPNGYVRPSPSSGTLGGVARKSRETMLICEAAGYDVIIVETVGVGQSEITVRSMVDFFLVMTLTGAGDELQGMKKGILELADAIVINKADGANKQAAQMVKTEFNRLLHFLPQVTEGWETKAYTVSALTHEGVPELWELILEFKEKGEEKGFFQTRRTNQSEDWVKALIEEQLIQRFYQHPQVKTLWPQLKEQMKNGETTPTVVATTLLDEYNQ